MSDRMAVMMDGDILQVGEPDDVYQNPQSIRVAEFIGSPKINILAGKSDNTGQLSCIDLALSQRVVDATNGDVSIGLRPEHLELCDKNTSGCFVGRLTYKENLGSDVFLYVALKDGTHRLIVRTRPHDAHDIAIGEELWIQPDQSKCLAFGADGDRLQLTGEATSEQAA
jgi:multiple sugar transport system ATP-binding protein